MEQFEFDNQNLEVEDSVFRIELRYESLFSNDKKINTEKYVQAIQVSDSGASELGIRVFKENNEINSGVIKGINGAVWLSKKDDIDESQSVEFKNDNLILSLGFNLISVKIPNLEINWNIVPDTAEIFEFYNLENDILLRGELQVHRIDRNGQIIWSYGGADIWVNIYGKQEVTILEDKIKLIDFNNDEYLIGFDGNPIANKKYNERTVNKKSVWWKFWE